MIQERRSKVNRAFNRIADLSNESVVWLKQEVFPLPRREETDTAGQALHKLSVRLGGLTAYMYGGATFRVLGAIADRGARLTGGRWESSQTR